MTTEREAPALVRALRMIDALPPEFKPSDDTPLRQALPGIWPTIGDLREFLAPTRPPAAAKSAHDPGRTAYEARCGDDKVGPRGLWDPWEMLPEEAKAVWRRVEAACSRSLETDHNQAQKLWYVTDFDRLGHRILHSWSEADAEAVRVAEAFPGNEIHVLETVAIHKRPLIDSRVKETAS